MQGELLSPICRKVRECLVRQSTNVAKISPVLRLPLPPPLEPGRVQLAPTVSLEALAQGFYQVVERPFAYLGLELLVRGLCSPRQANSQPQGLLVLPLVDSGHSLEVVQPVGETPLAAEGLGRDVGSANAHPADYAKCKQVPQSCTRVPSTNSTNIHAPGIISTEPTASSNTSTYIGCVCPLDKGCGLGTKGATCVIYFLEELTNYRKQ